MVMTETILDVHTPNTRQKLFEELYERAFPRVARFVRSRNGSFHDAKDIFQDALVIFYEKTAGKDMQIHISEEAYLLGISKHLWIRKFNRDRDHVTLDDLEKHINIPDENYPDIETNKLLLFLERTGKKCLELLRAFYYDRRSMEEVTQDFGYSTTHSATVQKFKCLEKMRDTVKEKSMRYEDFTK